MSFAPLLSLVALSLFPVSLAKPLTGRSTCFPNFEGVSVSMRTGNGYVTPYGGLPGGPSDPFWYLHQNGQWPPGYFIKDASNTELAMTWEWTFSSIEMTQVSDSGLNSFQQFDIECQACFPGAATAPAGTVVASDCSIKPRGVSSQCLQTAPRSPSSLFPEPCGSIPALQVFTFAT